MERERERSLYREKAKYIYRERQTEREREISIDREKAKDKYRERQTNRERERDNHGDDQADSGHYHYHYMSGSIQGWEYIHSTVRLEEREEEKEEKVILPYLEQNPTDNLESTDPTGQPGIDLYYWEIWNRPTLLGNLESTYPTGKPGINQVY